MTRFEAALLWEIEKGFRLLAIAILTKPFEEASTADATMIVRGLTEQLDLGKRGFMEARQMRE